MENFFYGDKFYSDISDLLEDIEVEDDNVKNLPDDWSIDCEDCSLEQMFVLTNEFVSNSILERTDKWEDRFPEDTDIVDIKIRKAIEAGIDVDKMNALMPKLWYPNGTMFTITKKDLISEVDTWNND